MPCVPLLRFSVVEGRGGKSESTKVTPLTSPSWALIPVASPGCSVAWALVLLSSVSMRISSVAAILGDQLSGSSYEVDFCRISVSFSCGVPEEEAIDGLYSFRP